MASPFIKRKFCWLYRLMGDSALSASTRVVGFQIWRHLNNVAEAAWPSEERLAGETGLNIKTVKRAVAALRETYLHVDFDVTGRCNSYELIFLPSDDGKNVPIDRDKFSNRRGQFVPNDGDNLGPLIRTSNLLQEGTCSGTPPNSRAIADGGWPAVKRRLVERFGRDTSVAWFEKLVHESTDDAEITLSAPTKFIVSYVKQNYADAIEGAWNTEHPDKPAVRVRLVMQQHQLRAAE